MAVAEVRLLLEGSYTLLAVNASDVPGSDLNKSIQWLTKLDSISTIVDMCVGSGDKGFFTTHDTPGDVVFIPAGYLVFTCGNMKMPKIMLMS